MPCNDVTESVEVELDGGDRLQRFELSKRTCGAPVGNALLLGYTRDLQADKLIDRSLLDLVPEVHEARHLDQFLLAKQLYALQSALQVYMGLAAGAKDEPFTVEAIEHDPDATLITGSLRVDLATEAIRACGNCGCATRKSKASKDRNATQSDAAS